ncbi:MAG TPA: PaaI family thioesterase [Bordetella sp.]
MQDIEQRIAASFGAQGLMETLGARLALVEEGEVHVALPFSRHIAQQHGFLHAGAVTSIVDNACGYAALTKAPPGCEVVTVEFKVNFLRPALGRHFLAVGKVQNAGRQLAVCTGEVRAFAGDDASYKVVALMQATIANVRNEVTGR